MTKYEPLENYLRSLKNREWRATFREIEKIIGESLPPSARKRPQWWKDDATHIQSHAWMKAGWRMSKASLSDETVVFIKAQAIKGKTKPFKNTVQEAESSMDIYACFSWRKIGDVSLDENHKPKFPKTPAEPGVYRLNFESGKARELYIGEAENLRRRFQNYRSPGPSQQTSLRINARIKEQIESGFAVSVAHITEKAKFNLNNESVKVDMQDKFQRRLIENAVLVFYRCSGVSILNKD